MSVCINRYSRLSLRIKYSIPFVLDDFLQGFGNIGMIFKNRFHKLNQFSDDLLIFYISILLWFRATVYYFQIFLKIKNTSATISIGNSEIYNW